MRTPTRKELNREIERLEMSILTNQKQIEIIIKNQEVILSIIKDYNAMLETTEG